VDRGLVVLLACESNERHIGDAEVEAASVAHALLDGLSGRCGLCQLLLDLK
jgi:hypothetical protein